MRKFQIHYPNTSSSIFTKYIRFYAWKLPKRFVIFRKKLTTNDYRKFAEKFTQVLSLQNQRKEEAKKKLRETEIMIETFLIFQVTSQTSVITNQVTNLTTRQKWSIRKTIWWLDVPIECGKLLMTFLRFWKRQITAESHGWLKL